MGGEIGASRIGKGRGKAMAAHGLQRVAEAGFVVAVVDYEHGEGSHRGAASKLIQEGPRRWPHFEDGTVRRFVWEVRRLVAEPTPHTPRPPPPPAHADATGEGGGRGSGAGGRGEGGEGAISWGARGEA